MDEKIIFRAGTQTGKEFQISDDDITIGRDLENSIVIDDIQISRNHLKIYKKEDTLFVEDLKSTNGSTLNGKSLKKAQKLKSGDTVTMGESNVFEVQIPGEVPAEPKTESKAKKEETVEPVKRGKLKIGKRDKQPKEVKEVLEKAQPQTEAPAKESKKITEKYPTWAVILMIALGFIIVFCLIPFVVIEVTDQWCNLFSGFFNAISPNVCP